MVIKKITPRVLGVLRQGNKKNHKENQAKTLKKKELFHDKLLNIGRENQRKNKAKYNDLTSIRHDPVNFEKMGENNELKSDELAE